jgi:hypothetical protein
MPVKSYINKNGYKILASEYRGYKAFVNARASNAIADINQKYADSLVSKETVDDVTSDETSHRDDLLGYADDMIALFDASVIDSSYEAAVYDIFYGISDGDLSFYDIMKLVDIGASTPSYDLLVMLDGMGYDAIVKDKESRIKRKLTQFNVSINGTLRSLRPFIDGYFNSFPCGFTSVYEKNYLVYPDICPLAVGSGECFRSVRDAETTYYQDMSSYSELSASSLSGMTNEFSERMKKICDLSCKRIDDGSEYHPLFLYEPGFKNGLANDGHLDSIAVSVIGGRYRMLSPEMVDGYIDSFMLDFVRYIDKLMLSESSDGKDYYYDDSAMIPFQDFIKSYSPFTALSFDTANATSSSNIDGIDDIAKIKSALLIDYFVNNLPVPSKELSVLAEGSLDTIKDYLIKARAFILKDDRFKEGDNGILS